MSSDATGTTGTFGPRALSVYELGWLRGFYSQKVNSAAVTTYPCDGTTGTAYQLTNEQPNPIPGRNLATTPVGQPIVVQVRPGNDIAITSASMREKVSGTVVTLRPPLTRASDPNHMIITGQAVLIPDTPLLPNTQYEVSISGNNTIATFINGVWVTTGTNPTIPSNSTGAFTKTFTFTTGQ